MSWSKIPLVRIVIPYAIGIVIFVECNIIVGLFPLLSTVIMLALLFFYFARLQKSYRKRWIVGMLSFILFILSGGLSVTLMKATQKPIQDLPSARLTVIGELEDIDRRGDSASSIIVVIKQLYLDSLRPIEPTAKVQVYVKSLIDPKVELGDVIAFQAFLNEPKAPLNPYDFDYASFLNQRGIFYQAFTNKVIHLKSKNSIFGYAFSMREKLINQFRQAGIDSDELSVLTAISLGDKSSLSTEVKTRYAGAGAMHILAVSGLHVGIVYLIFNALFRFSNKRAMLRWAKALLLLIVVWGFAFLTGLSPSVQRASCMFSFVIIANALKRNSNILNSISAAALIILFINPLQLYEVGFQLSFAAVIGIVSIHPKIYPWITFNNLILDKAWSLVVVSIAAQLATLPFTLYYFHQFPNWFLLTNLIVIPLAFAIVGGAVLLSALWLIFETDFYFAKLLDFILKALNQVIIQIENLPFFNTEGIWIEPMTSLLLVITIVLLITYLHFYRNTLFISFLICLTALLMVELLFDYHKMSKNYYAQLSTPKSLTFLFKKGNYVYVLYDSDSLSQYSIQMIHNHLSAEGVNNYELLSLNQDNHLEHPRLQMRKVNGNYFLFYQNQLHLIANNDFPKINLIPHKLESITFNNEHAIESFMANKSWQSTKNIIVSSRIPSWSPSLSRFESFSNGLDLSTSVSNVSILNRGGYRCFELP